MKMNTTDVLFAGFGGHGMLLAGKLLAQAAVNRGLQVSWLPAYGAEMRGGTANVTVCMSGSRVASPYIEHPASLVVMNTPSLLKYGPKVKKGGLIVINTTLAREPWTREDCPVLSLPAGDMAREVGAWKSTNLVLLGAWAGYTGVLSRDAIVETIEEQFSMKHAVMNANVAAFDTGFRQGATARPAPGMANEVDSRTLDRGNAHLDHRTAR